jgi:outer membrane protein OmpA-like peptidoglycan-associated protein
VVLKVTLRCRDVDGFSNGLELSPWQIEIPHEDVRFATGRWNVEPSEVGKVDQAVTQIATTLRRYSSVLELRLFISGHTDTVGEAAFNRRLSEKRARSIARLFRQRGVSIPIAWYGAGEDEQRVVTPDATPEPRNRRTRYLLAVHPPAGRRWLALE